MTAHTHSLHNISSYFDSDYETKEEMFGEHHETARDKYEMSTANIGPQDAQSTHYLGVTQEMKPGESETGFQNEIPASPKNTQDSAIQQESNNTSGDELLNAEENDEQYPSRIRLTFLTFGLMAVVLMVALDNYILGTLLIIFLF